MLVIKMFVKTIVKMIFWIQRIIDPLMGTSTIFAGGEEGASPSTTQMFLYCSWDSNQHITKSP